MANDQITGDKKEKSIRITPIDPSKQLFRIESIDSNGVSTILPVSKVKSYTEKLHTSMIVSNLEDNQENKLDWIDHSPADPFWDETLLASFSPEPEENLNPSFNISRKTPNYHRFEPIGKGLENHYVYKPLAPDIMYRCGECGVHAIDHSEYRAHKYCKACFKKRIIEDLKSGLKNYVNGYGISNIEKIVKKFKVN